MRKLTLCLITAISLAGLLALVLLQHHTQAELHKQAAVLREQEKQLAEVAAEHLRLSNLLAQVRSASAGQQLSELQKLRSEAERLRKQTQETEKHLGGTRQSRPLDSSRQDQHPPQYWEQVHRIAGGKSKDALLLSAACLRYAAVNQGQFPSNLDQVRVYLSQGSVLTGTNEFELLYQGSLDELRNIPSSEVALIRDRQAWLAPSGKWAKVYGMHGGVSQIVESADNFQSWEAQHVVPPPAP